MNPLIIGLIGGVFILAILAASVGRVEAAHKQGWSKGYDEGYKDGCRNEQSPIIKGQSMSSGTPFRASTTKTRKPRADKGLKKCVCGRRFKANGIKRHQASCVSFHESLMS